MNEIIQWIATGVVVILAAWYLWKHLAGKGTGSCDSCCGSCASRKDCSKPHK